MDKDTKDDQEERDPLEERYDSLVHSNDEQADSGSETISSDQSTTSEQPDSENSDMAQSSSQVPSTKFNLNKYFLYTLVGGLIISALISVVAVLIGEFNSTVSRALGTTVSMVIHTLLALLLISANTKSEKQSGSLLINTLIFITVASFITSILSIWNIITGQIVGDLYIIYFYTFCASLWSRLLLRVGENLLDKPTRIISQAAIGFTALLYTLLIPSTLTHYPNTLPDLYYRTMAATAILLATASVLTTVFHRIYIFKHPEVKSLPSVKSGWDIVLAIIVLFVGVPFIFGVMVSLMAHNISDSESNRQTHIESSQSTQSDDSTSTIDKIKDKDYPYKNTASERKVPYDTTLLDSMTSGKVSNAHMACDIVDNSNLYSDGVFYEFESFGQSMQSATLSTRGLSAYSDYMDDFLVSYTRDSTLYNKDCKKINPTDFNKGDVVNLYFSQDNGSVITDVVAIQKIN